MIGAIENGNINMLQCFNSFVQRVSFFSPLKEQSFYIPPSISHQAAVENILCSLLPRAWGAMLKRNEQSNNWWELSAACVGGLTDLYPVQCLKLFNEYLDKTKEVKTCVIDALLKGLDRVVQKRVPDSLASAIVRGALAVLQLLQGDVHYTSSSEFLSFLNSMIRYGSVSPLVPCMLLICLYVHRLSMPLLTR